MPRTLSATTSTAVGLLATRPITLVQIDYSAVLRLSSNVSVTWNGFSWVGSGIVGGVQVSAQPSGAQECGFTVPDPDNLVSAYVLNEGAEGIRIQAWELSGDGPYATGDAVAVFDGQLRQAERTVQGWRFSAATDAVRGGIAPRRVIGSLTGFNHVTAAGTIITTPTEIFTLRPRRG